MLSAASTSAASATTAATAAIAAPLTVTQFANTNDGAPSQPAEADLVKILDLEEIDTNMFRGYSPVAPRWGRIYGGQSVAQGLVACCRTVDPKFVVHSLHAYFLRPGNDNLSIQYYVERLRNGRSFASRRVTALQKGSAIFAMMVSFMTHEDGREHQDTMPVVPPPESVKGLPENYRDILKEPRLSPSVRKGIERSLSMPFPVDLRRVTPATLADRLTPQPNPVHRSWVRVLGHLPNNVMLHQCALAYLSDWSLLETSLLPHGLHGWIPDENNCSVQMASIDHTIHFHHPFRADDWLLYDMDSPSASGSRGFTRGRFFTRDGKLVVSTSQEGLIRVHQGPPPKPRPVGYSRNDQTSNNANANKSDNEAGTGKTTTTNATNMIRANL